MVRVGLTGYSSDDINKFLSHTLSYPSTPIPSL